MWLPSPNQQSGHPRLACGELVRWPQQMGPLHVVRPSGIDWRGVKCESIIDGLAVGLGFAVFCLSTVRFYVEPISVYLATDELAELKRSNLEPRVHTTVVQQRIVNRGGTKSNGMGRVRNADICLATFVKHTPPRVDSPLRLRQPQSSAKQRHIPGTYSKYAVLFSLLPGLHADRGYRYSAI